MSKVYLAGPIAGLTYDGAEDWRSYARTKLAEAGIEGFSPLRAQEYLRRVGTLSNHGHDRDDMSCMSTSRGITTRDRFDATTCDAMLVNLLDATKVSIGTMIELGWADAHRIPTVVAIPEGVHPHHHMMVEELTGFSVRSLDEAIHVLKSILRP